ncbi:Methyltransferase-like protein 17, mitochondrial [Smittium culicis]|uniref:Methyltransferase-like protein 17, mitochondrial n=1 Tax=Smittium culicis TaxID=133412 RepID=A0A1R1YJ98_9FUNG|nr:Methyltransferase-like protein 17, mitochondrial [Smittium culicis]
MSSLIFTRLPTDTDADILVKDSVESIDQFYKEYYDNYIENKKPVLRGTDSIRLGRKYISMVILPKFLVDSTSKYLDDKDKKLLRTDTLRIIDSIRSTERIIPDEKKKKSIKSDGRDNFVNGVAIANPKPFVKPVYSLLNNEVALSPHKLDYGLRESYAYLASIFPSSYSITYNVFREISKRVPNFSPEKILDFGCGPASSLWPANEFWGDKISQYHGVDVSDPMLQVAESLVELSKDDLQAKDIKFSRFLSAKSNTSYNMVVSSFTLSELFSDELRKSTLENLWSQTTDFLVLIERGTPLGAKYISDARKYFVSRKKDPESKQGEELNNSSSDSINHTTKKQSEENLDVSSDFHFFSPCPHEKVCPLDATLTFCHFSQRVQRPEMTMKSKHAKINEEDTKYSYLVIRRGPRPSLASNKTIESPKSLDSNHVQNSNFRDHVDNELLQDNEEKLTEDTLISESYSWPRLLLPAMKRSGHVLVDVCSSNGDTERRIFTKSHSNQSYRDARKVQWGDLFPHSPKTTLTKKISYKPYI